MMTAYDELYERVSNSGKHLMESIQTTSKEPLDVKNNLIVCGMGGSGISGDFIKELSRDSSQKQVVVNKNYNLPAKVSGDWNAVVISYSGNTEETLSAFYQLIDKGIKPVCISSGGKLLKKAKELNLQFIQIPSGIQPRAAFPFLFGSLYGLVAESLNLNLPDVEMENRIIASSKIEKTTEYEKVCQQLLTKFPIIVHPNDLGCVAKRFRCQLNENAKTPGATYEAPEFSHNAIIGFDGQRGDEQAILLLRSDHEFSKTSIHLNFIRDELSKVAGYFYEFKVNSDSLFEELLKFTWILDWISVKLAEIQEIDPNAIPSIDKLKSVLKNK